MELEERRRYYRNCADVPLEPDDPRNLDLDALPEPHPRGGSWVKRLCARIELTEGATLQLVTGLPGTGKSTELKRLAERLSDPEGQHLLMALLDAEEGIDLTQPVDIPDILALALHQAEQAVLQAEGRDPKDALKDGYLTRFWKWLRDTDVSLTTAEFEVPATGATLTAELKTRGNLRQRVREIVANNLTTFLQQVSLEFRMLEVRAKNANYSGLALIVDSLEKLRGTNENWESVLQSAERVFGGEAAYLRLPVHVVYTVPAALTYRLAAEVEFLPMIKLRERDGKPSPGGRKAMRELVLRRIEERGLAELFGEAWEERVDLLISRSGGYPREILQALRWMLELGRMPVTLDDLERQFSEVRDRLSATFTRKDVEWLVEVARTGTLIGRDDDSWIHADRAMRNNAVLRYANHEVWYDLHPAMRDTPLLKEHLASPKA